MTSLCLGELCTMLYPKPQTLNPIPYHPTVSPKCQADPLQVPDSDAEAPPSRSFNPGDPEPLSSSFLWFIFRIL